MRGCPRWRHRCQIHCLLRWGLVMIPSVGLGGRTRAGAGSAASEASAASFVSASGPWRRVVPRFLLVFSLRRSNGGAGVVGDMDWCGVGRGGVGRKRRVVQRFVRSRISKASRMSTMSHFYRGPRTVPTITHFDNPAEYYHKALLGVSTGAVS